MIKLTYNILNTTTFKKVEDAFIHGNNLYIKIKSNTNIGDNFALRIIDYSIIHFKEDDEVHPVDLSIEVNYA